MDHSHAPKAFTLAMKSRNSESILSALGGAASGRGAPVTAGAMAGRLGGGDTASASGVTGATRAGGRVAGGAALGLRTSKDAGTIEGRWCAFDSTLGIDSFAAAAVSSAVSPDETAGPGAVGCVSCCARRAFTASAAVTAAGANACGKGAGGLGGGKETGGADATLRAGGHEAGGRGASHADGAEGIDGGRMTAHLGRWDAACVDVCEVWRVERASASAAACAFRLTPVMAERSMSS